MDTGNENVRNACIAMLKNLEYKKFYNTPYCAPLINYVMTWQYALPIKTIIIGQNPYPQPIYPIYGAAMSYDETICKRPPGSVRVIAEDLYNYNGTDKNSTIDCFRDLWKMTDKGVIAINETVFSKIVDSEKDSNLRPIREAEYQVRTLQVLIAESYFMGQTSINCIGMGMSAAMMTNIMRGWCPNDLVSLKVLTCANPAAYASNLSDSTSHPITFGNSTISRILSSIVEEYTNMPPKGQDKRLQQNIDSFKANTKQVIEADASCKREYSSLLERLKAVKKVPEAKDVLLALEDSLQRCVNTMDNHATAMDAHMMTYVMNVNAIQHQRSNKPDSVASSIAASTVHQPVSQSPSPATPRRVARPVTRRAPSAMSEVSTPGVESIKEEASPELNETPIKPSPVVSGTPGSSRPVRRPVRRPASSRAPSVAETEYTNVSGGAGGTIKVGSTEKINPVEKVHIEAIASWFRDNMDGDTTYSEMIETTASQGIISSAVSRNVLDYVRSRMSQSTGYDAYEELNGDNSEKSDTKVWCKKYASELQSS